MVAIRKAIDSAFETLSELVENAGHVELEEVLLGPDEKTWRITLSYLVPFVPNELTVAEESTSPFYGKSQTRYVTTGSVDKSTPLLVRRFKTIELDRDSGDFRQLLARELGKH